MRSVVRSRALLADTRFLSLWLSQGLAQTAQNALLFTLLVIVLRITGSSVHTSLLILCFILPSIPWGSWSGVADRVDKTRCWSQRACCARGPALFFFFHQTSGASTRSVSGWPPRTLLQPAVVSMIPTIPRERLVPANSLYNFTLTASQLIGIVFIAPTLLKLVGADGLFVTTGLLFVAAAASATRVRGPIVPDNRAPATIGTIHTEFRESFRALTSDRYSVLALSQLIVSSTLVLLFAILIPRYMQDVIDVPADNAALVFAPTGIGRSLVPVRRGRAIRQEPHGGDQASGDRGVPALLALVRPIAEVWRRARTNSTRAGAEGFPCRRW
jgi:hypothetical protein